MDEIVRRVSAIIDNPDGIIYVRDESGKYLYINEPYERLLGITQADVLGKTNTDIYGQEAERNWKVADSLVLATNEPTVTTETFYDQKKRTWRRFITTKLVLWDNNNKRLLIGVSIEVFSDKELVRESQLAKLKVYALQAASSGSPPDTFHPMPANDVVILPKKDIE